MQKFLVSLVLALAVSALSVTANPARTATNPGVTAEAPSSMVNSIKSGLEKAGVPSATIENFQKDPHASLYSAMSHLGSFVTDTTAKGLASAQASATDLYQTTKTLAGEHANAINSYVNLASEAGRKAAATTSDLLTKSYPNALGLPDISLRASSSGGITGFGI